MAKQLSVQDVLRKAGGSKKKAKGTPAPKKTPAWQRYKNEHRAYHHQIRRIEAHIAKHPNDLPAASALTRIRNAHYGVAA